MKKIVAILLAMVFLISGSAMVASAYTPGVDDGQIDADDIFGQMSVALEESTVKAGETVSVDLKTKNNTGFTELVVTLTLDEGITLAGVTAPEGIAVAMDGNVVTIISEEAITADVVVAVLQFTAAEDTSGKKTVAMGLTAKNGEDIVNTAASNGYITVKSASQPALVGDVDGDGARNAADLALLKKVIAGLTALDDPKVVAPDVDGSGGNPNAADLAKLKKLIAGLE